MSRPGQTQAEAAKIHLGAALVLINPAPRNCPSYNDFWPVATIFVQANNFKPGQNTDKLAGYGWYEACSTISQDNRHERVE
jgi:hypothetical protein